MALPLSSRDGVALRQLVNHSAQKKWIEGPADERREPCVAQALASVARGQDRHGGNAQPAHGSEGNDVAYDLEPVMRHRDVAHDDVGAELPQNGLARLDVRGVGDECSAILERRGEQLRGAGVIPDEKHVDADEMLVGAAERLVTRHGRVLAAQIAGNVTDLAAIECGASAVRNQSLASETGIRDNGQGLTSPRWPMLVDAGRPAYWTLAQGAWRGKQSDGAPQCLLGLGPIARTDQTLDNAIMARPPRKRTATISEVRRDADTCTVCEETLTLSARVAWTVGRGRLHEECLAKAGLTSARDGQSTRRVHGIRISPLLLRRMSLCASCLAMDLRVSLAEARDLMQRVDGVNGLKVIQMPCASCGRHVDTLQTPTEIVPA
jgi:hypothetical protein